MKRLRLVPTALFVMFVASACSKPETSPPAAAPAPAAPAAAKAPAAETRVLQIPVLPGYKYYVGGPVLSRDAYGRFRISSFNGEVQQPPSRGMIFGVKRDGDQIEYRVWGNGTPLGYHKGIMRDGLYWELYGESFRLGKLVARERTTHDDDAKRSKIVTEDLDPETGELIRTKETSLSYLPPKLADPDFEDDEDEEDEGEGEVPAGIVAPGGVAPVAPAAPAAPPPAAK